MRVYAYIHIYLYIYVDHFVVTYPHSGSLCEANLFFAMQKKYFLSEVDWKMKKKAGKLKNAFKSGLYGVNLYRLSSPEPMNSKAGTWVCGVDVCE